MVIAIFGPALRLAQMKARSSGAHAGKATLAVQCLLSEHSDISLFGGVPQALTRIEHIRKMLPPTCWADCDGLAHGADSATTYSMCDLDGKSPRRIFPS